MTFYLTALPAVVAAIACLTCNSGVLAQAQPDLPRSIELSGDLQNLNAGFGSWRDVNLRGTYALPSHVLQGEIVASRRFNKDGVLVGLSDTYTFNDDWYSRIAVGLGDGAFYLPRFRVDAAIYKKRLPDRNLVGSLGVGYYKAPDGHADSSVSIGAAYYFAQPWIVEGGVRFNSSNPGAIKTQQQFAALTYGRAKQDLVTVRFGRGAEGYQTITANTQLVNFKSQEASLSWRHWLTARTGILAGVNQYSNPFYNRSGVSVGLFHDF